MPSSTAVTWIGTLYKSIHLETKDPVASMHHSVPARREVPGALLTDEDEWVFFVSLTHFMVTKTTKPKPGMWFIPGI
jgi:hypothetical protein